jgi:ATP-dependent DNA helicase Q4
LLTKGFGKSLIYQMAATLYAKRYPGSVVLVVSPLISLMQDQVFNLSKSLKAAVCDSQLTDKDFQQLLADLDAGRINILFMSPEAVMRKKIRNIPRLAFVCIDEIHCLSQWSHNFRPSYLQLSEVS